VIERVRSEDGTEHDAAEFFPTMGGYLTRHP
jgi:methionyl-tRNA formyltransferase